MTVTKVAVTARPTVPGCDGTADIVGLVTTNGRRGTLSYRWVRLHLRWTYQGPGHRAARAELRILSPGHRATAAHFSYDCAALLAGYNVDPALDLQDASRAQDGDQ
ncbi:hypothetical protein AB0I69_14790 [Streptomyces sp. NPDC050508]|uniref:hypothetical protein n=1 Tax=Streptomyces sp. NPDC050508 TaxID=3155405 RepID=UPI003425B3B1